MFGCHAYTCFIPTRNPPYDLYKPGEAVVYKPKAATPIRTPTAKKVHQYSRHIAARAPLALANMSIAELPVRLDLAALYHHVRLR